MEQRTVSELPDAPPGSFSRLYPQLTGAHCGVAETATHQRVLREKIVRCLWFDQFLDPELLATEDGRKLTIFSPGYWSEGAGPDFRNAEFAFDGGPRRRGDVEVHVNASEWRAHGHAEDAAYDKVLLHVVLHNDTGGPTITQRGRAVPQLALEGRLSADLDEILAGLDPDGYPRVGCGREGNCARSIRAAGRDAAWIGRFLDIAGDERMLRKAEHFATRMNAGTPDDAMYESLLDTMGYSANRRGFRQLAGTVGLEALRRSVPLDAPLGEKLLWTQGILMGAAGFLDAAKPAGDAESAAYHAELARRWQAAQSDRGIALREPIAWNLGRTRPTNHPLRRIAGISAFLAAHLHEGLCRGMMVAAEGMPVGGPPRARREALEKFRQMLDPEPQPFWARRTGFGPACLPRATALIGAARTSEIIVNVAIPLLLALARRGDQERIEMKLHHLYCALRPLPENSLTEYMKTRIFDSPEAADRAVNSMRRQQGLLQLFHDYCESGQGTCEQCGFLAAVEGV